MAAPGPEYEPLRIAIRARGHVVNPYRLGCESERSGARLPNPYPKGTRGNKLYSDGVNWVVRNERLYWRF